VAVGRDSRGTFPDRRFLFWGGGFRGPRDGRWARATNARPEIGKTRLRPKWLDRKTYYYDIIYYYYVIIFMAYNARAYTYCTSPSVMHTPPPDTPPKRV